MAPEQLATPALVSPATDLYALGCVLYECATASLAFSGESVMAVFAKIAVGETPRIRTDRADARLPALDALVSSLLSRDQAARPRDAAEVAATLRRIEAGEVASPAPAAVGAAERRVVTVVLAAMPAPSHIASDATLPASSALESKLEGLGTAVRVLHDGTVLCLARGASSRDQALAASRASLAIRRIRPELTIAIATGRAQTSSGVPVGDAIDRATRLLAGPPAPGEIRIDDLTCELVDGRFEIAPSEPRTLLGPARVASAERPVLGRVPACVGRQRELAFVTSLLDEARDDRAPKVVVISGPPGVGKSRLRREIVRAIASAPSRVAPVVARAEEIGAASPYAMLGALVRDAFGIREGDEPGVAISTIREQLGSASDPRAAHAALFLAEIGGSPAPPGQSALLDEARRDPAVMRAGVIEAARTWLAAADRSWALILDDLHWSDAASVETIDAALRATPDRPIVIVALARPEAHERFPGLFAQHAPSEIKLPPLARSAAVRMIREILPDTSEEVASALAVQAQGLPLMIEELARAHATGAADGARGTLETLIEARLQELEAEPRRFLRAASVFGGSFWLDGARSLVGCSPTDAAAIVARLVDAELVVEGPSRLVGQRELTFRHALYRACAYEMITDADRRAAHRGAAAWLESVGDSDRATRAAHLERGAESDLDRRAAIDALLECLERSATRDRDGWIERAARVCEGMAEPDGELRIRVDLARCATRVYANRVGAAVHARQLVALADELGARAHRCETRMLLVQILAGDGELEEATAVVAQLVPLVEEDEERWMLARAEMFLAYYRGDLDEAHAAAHRCLALSRERGRPRQVATDAHNAADFALRTGRIDEARELARESDAIRFRYGLEEVVMNNAQVLELASLVEGDVAVIERIRDFARGGRERDDGWFVLESELVLGIAEAWAGAPAAARAQLIELARAASALGHRMLSLEASSAVEAIDRAELPWFRGGRPPVRRAP